MAAQQMQSPLRRWKRFFPMFSTIDDAVVASCSRPGGNGKQHDEKALTVLRRATDGIFQDLREAPADDPAEDLCRILDTVMVEYLLALKAVTVPLTEPAAPTDLARALGVLQEHQAPHIRSLARRIVRMWREPVKLTPSPPSPTKKHNTAKTTKSKTARIRRVEPLPKKSAPVTRARRANTAASIHKTKPTAKKMTVVANGYAAGMVIKRAATKRKLQEAADAKRQRPKMVEKAAEDASRAKRAKLIEQDAGPPTAARRSCC